MLASPGRNFGIGAVLAVSALLLAACGSGAGSSGAGNSVKIAFLGYTISDFPNAMMKGARSVVEPIGGVVTPYDANFDPQKQLTQCQDVVTSKRFQAIILSPVDPAIGGPCLQLAKAAGIPVATFESAVGDDPYSLKPPDGVVAVVATPLETEVDADSALITTACGPAVPCRVVAEVATPTDRFSNDVLDGVGRKLAPKMQIVQKIASHYDPGEITKAMPDVLSAHHDINVFFAASDQSGLAALPALQQAGLATQVKITGRGGSSEGAAAVRNGSLFGTTANWPQQYGVFLARTLSDAVYGRPIATSSLDMLKADTPMLVTADTVAQFKPEWGSGS